MLGQRSVRRSASGEPRKRLRKVNSMTDEPALSTERRKLQDADLQRANIPEAFWRVKTNKVQEGKVRDLVFRYRREIVNMLATSSGVLFTGEEGVGKTSAAVCLLKEAMAANFNCYFVTHTEIKELSSERFPSLYGSGADGITVKRYIETAELVVLDGFNDFGDKEYGAIQLEELLMRRASQRLTTIMTTRSAETLRHQKNRTLYEAVTYCMVPVLIEGKNMRDEIRKEKDDRVKGRI